LHKACGQILAGLQLSVLKQKGSAGEVGLGRGRAIASHGRKRSTCRN